MRNILREIREEQDLSQTELGVSVNVSRQTIHSIETGKFIPSTVLSLKIAAFFKISVEEIFTLEEGD